jgi:hypothetical protein
MIRPGFPSSRGTADHDFLVGECRATIAVAVNPGSPAGPKKNPVTGAPHRPGGRDVEDLEPPKDRPLLSVSIRG